MSNTEEFAKRAEQIQEFRYSVIAELLNPYLSRAERQQLISEKAGREYEIPSSGRTMIGEETIRRWVQVVRRYGKEGLRPHQRKDSGLCRSLSPEETEALRAALEAHPELTAIAVLRKLQAAQTITSQLSTTSLSRLVRSGGLDRRNRWRAQEERQQLKFQFETPLECIQVDDLHGPRVPDERGKLRKAILMAFLDDATRRIVYASWSFTERSVEFEAGIKHILLAHGRIGRLYVDHGSPFVSLQTKRICDILGVLICHSRVGRPAGRGKVERFFRTVREQFLRPLDESSLKSLADLNTRFRTWLEGHYHRSPHRGLRGQTPLDAWLRKAHLIVPLDPTIDLDRVFLHEETRRVYKDCTVTVGGTLYEVSEALVGKRPRLRYDPRVALKRISVEYEGIEYGEARLVDAYANTQVKRRSQNRNNVEPRDTPAPSEHQPPDSPTAAGLSASEIDLSEPSDATEENSPEGGTSDEQ